RRTAASISRRNPSIVSIVSTSMWFVGSSSRRTSFSFAFARARAVRTLDFSPPEREPNRWSRSSSPTPRSFRIGSFTITLSLRAGAVPEPRFEDEVPQVRHRLAREEPEQGALPRAVRTDEGDLVPRVEEEVRVLEDERGTPGFPEVPARDDRLHVAGASRWSA